MTLESKRIRNKQVSSRHSKSRDVAQARTLEVERARRVLVLLLERAVPAQLEVAVHLHVVHPGVPYLHLEPHRGVEQQPHRHAPRRHLSGEPRPHLVARRRARRGEAPLQLCAALGHLEEGPVAGGARRDELVAVVDRGVDGLVVDADLAVGVVLVDGEANGEVGQAGLPVGVGDVEVSERELGAVRPEAQPHHEENDAGDEDQREQHRAEEVNAPHAGVLPVVQRQPRHVLLR
jgi:hypothetical protein